MGGRAAKGIVCRQAVKGKNLASAWRQSFSLEEKEKFNAMDSDGGCRKKVLRVLKVIRNREVSLQPLMLFLLKIALFTEIDKRSSQNDWKFAIVWENCCGM